MEEPLALKKPITVGEIENAIGALNNGKALGPDGLPIEFYKVNIEWIIEELLEVYKEAIEIGSLGLDINRGIIKLLPKDGDKSLIKNWRPITLLNVSYKILAKVLAHRLVDILPRFICSTQTGFIKGRCILENLITSWEAMEWAKVSNQNVAMFLLDFEKAYDGVEWGFIIMMLEAISFPKEFCHLIQVLLKDASTQLDINGSITEAFNLGRSIRQGCPLAPSLFVIAADAIFYLLRDSSLSLKVKGINLPNNTDLLNIQFVDDTTLFLELEESNVESLISKLKIFGEASRPKISQSRSILLGWLESPLEWLSLGINGEGHLSRSDTWAFPSLSLIVLKICGYGLRENLILC